MAALVVDRWQRRSPDGLLARGQGRYKAVGERGDMRESKREFG